jgi:uncharacterized protein YbaP (TraB family)
MKRILLGFLLILMTCSQSVAESSVWKVQKGDSVMYLGGTCHVLRPSDFPLPAEFENAYASSDLLVFETDIGRFSDMSAQQKLMVKAMYDDGSTVDKHLSAGTYRMLEAYCTANGIPLSNLKQFKPSIIAVTMVVMELSKIGAGQDGVDMFYYQSANRDSKPIVGFETIDEQIDYIVGMGEGNEDEFITYTIEDLKSIKQDYEALVGAWKEGDVEALCDHVISDIKTKMPRLYKSLLTDRNDRWLPVIESYLGTPEREYILVGVGHLVGPEGIIDALQQKGCRVEKL